MDEVAADSFVSSLDYPVFVVTTRDGDERAGCLIGFATQTSIDPWRMVICLSQQNRTTRVAAGADFVAVHQLASDQHQLAARFAELTGDEVDKFAGGGWASGPHGLPILDDCPAWFTGRILDRYDLGDHRGHLLAPTHVERQRDAAPLMFSAVQDMQPGHES